MLTATNEAHSTDFFGKKDLHGGYFARTFVISETKRNRANSLLVPLINPPKYEEAIAYLKVLEGLKGPFAPLACRTETDTCTIPHVELETGETNFFSPAGLIYQEWYEEFIETMQFQEVKDETGTLNRFGDSVLKVAMLLSLSKAPDLIIDEECMQQAIKYCEKLVGNVREMTYGKKGLSDAKGIKNLIIAELLTRDSHQISRPMLLKKMWAHYKDATELDEIMQSFDQAKMILTENVGNQILYIMPENMVGELRRLYAGKFK
jgi:hypothetical protein